ncbi:glycosyltransferase [Lacinutrix iliipiscaria]|uniref:Glycosyltransferase n=1 Tax=Lacinutrix iliipiscaria TaxID=1230532 RepID=A0ABW5WPB7_9FLAO
MQKKLLIIGYVWPEPNSSAAGSRMMQLIFCFQAYNYQITFASPCAKSDKAFDLNSIGVTPMSIEINDSHFDDFINNFNPEVVVFDRFMMEEQFGWRVAENCPNALRILDTEDLHSLRKGRQQAFKAKTEFDDSDLFNDTAKREIASIYRCDLSLIISEAEMDLLKHRFKVDESLLLYLPFLLDEIDSENIQNLPKFDNRQHFITIGNFLHEPNYNSILYLKETIWPLIRQQLPKVDMHIYGAYSSQKINQLHNQKEGFLIQGFAEDAQHVMQNARVCLAPLRFGAGLKGKLIDAMQNGTPSVMTSIASEGLFGDLEPHGYTEDDPEEYANKAVQLYTNKTLWEAKQQNGFIALRRFDKKEFQNQLHHKLNDLRHQLITHRFNNFTGQMLMHHTLQSTKYLSRWIEEKHKNQ